MYTRWLVLTVWAAVLSSALVGPPLLRLPASGDLPTRWTIRVALLFYAVALAGTIRTGLMPEATKRLCWSLAWSAYLIHVALAFHYSHHWSHIEAVQHTQEQSGFGEGIYASYLFTLVWTADVIWWWCDQAGHRARPCWLGALLHAFMLFMIFNATVVFANGGIRWVGLIVLVSLGGLWLVSRNRK